ncbi:MAG: hypothetical protein HY547_09325 [Elusimicrobia bacterium]|nr:hypothetical protein [Elusimicrobiota bacterium]
MIILNTFLPTLGWTGTIPDYPFSNKARGTTGAAFLKLPVSARNSSLADTIGYSMIDPLSGWRDPSAFAGPPGRHYLAFASGFLPESIIQAAVAYGHALGRDGNKKFFLSANEIIQPPLTLYDTLGQETGEFSPLDSAVAAGYAAHGNDWRWGMDLTYIQSNISPTYNGRGIAASAGLGLLNGFFTDPNLSLGFALNNAGPALDWAGHKVPLPLIIQSHMGYKVGDPIFLFFDLMTPVDQAAYGAVSFEWKIPFQLLASGSIDPATGLAIRSGATFKNNTESFVEKMSFGLGLYLGDVAIDAGMSSFGDLGYVPHVGVNLDFGSPSKARSAGRRRRPKRAQELPNVSAGMPGTQASADEPLNAPPAAIETRHENKINVAVIDFEGRGLSETETLALTDFFRGALIDQQKFRVIDRNNVEAILAEIKLQQTGCSTTECAVRVGKMLNVQKIFTGSALEMNEGCFLTIRFIDVETTEIVSSLTIKSRSYRGLIQKTQKLAQDFLAKINTQRSVKETAP